MKKLLSVQKILILVLAICVFMYATNADANWLGKITGKLFSQILKFVGFGSGENQYCWFCPLFVVLFDTINTLATTIASNLRDVLLATLGVGILFFIAFRVGATVIKLQEVDLMQFLGDLFKHLGRAIIAAALIAGTIQIFHYLISPLLTYSLNLAITFMQSYTLTGNADTDSYLKIAVGDITESATSICGGFSNSAGDNYSGAFSPDLKNAMRCMLATMSANLILGMVVGLVVLGMGLVANWIFPDIQMSLSGAVIFGSFFMIYLAVPFRLVDNLMRLAFVGALMPFWIILWVFPATVQYTKNAWNMFLAACVNFVAFGIVLAMIMQILAYMVPDMNQILESMIPGYDMVASAKASVFTKNTLLTLALGLFCKSMLQAPEDLSARITQSYGFGVGQGLEQQASKVGATALGWAGGAASVGILAASGGYEQAQAGIKNLKKKLGFKDDSSLVGTVWDSMTKPAAQGRYTGSSSDAEKSATSGSPAPASAPTPAATPAPAPTPASTPRP